MQKAASVSPLRPGSLRSSASFRTVLATGRRRRIGDLVVVRAVGQAGMVRFGLVAGRRIGSAVVRNRAKRRLREAIRSAGLPVGYDFVIIAGKSVPHVPFPTLVSWLQDSVSALHEPVPTLHERGAVNRGRV